VTYVPGSGALVLRLKVGADTVDATYAGGSGTQTLTFTYTVEAGRNDGSGISIDESALALSGGATLRDGVGANALLAHGAVADDASYRVDTTPPVAGTLALANYSDSGDSTADFVSKDNSFDLSWTGWEGNTALVFQRSVDNGVTWDTTVQAQNALIDGRYLYRGSITDLAGNRIGSLTVRFTDAAGVSVVRNAVPAGGVWSLPSVDLSALAGSGDVGLSVASASGAVLQTPAFVRVGAAPSSSVVDRTVPTVNHIDLPASGLYGAGREMVFKLGLSEATGVDTTAGAPTLELDIVLQGVAGSRSAVAVYDAAASSPTSKVFRYVVPAGDAVLSAQVNRLQLNRAVFADALRWLGPAALVFIALTQAFPGTKLAELLRRVRVNDAQMFQK
jgi:hypothetical protein